MSPQENLSLSIVFLLILAVYGCAAWGLFRGIVEKLGIIEKETLPLFIWLRRSMYALALIGFGCFAYAYFIEPYWLEVRKIEIRSTKKNRILSRFGLSIFPIFTVTDSPDLKKICQTKLPNKSLI